MRESFLIENKIPLRREWSKVTVTSLNTFQMRIVRNNFTLMSKRLK